MCPCDELFAGKVASHSLSVKVQPGHLTSVNPLIVLCLTCGAQDVVETTLALDNFRKACDSGRGAVFLSVARGKVRGRASVAKVQVCVHRCAILLIVCVSCVSVHVAHASVCAFDTSDLCLEEQHTCTHSASTHTQSGGWHDKLTFDSKCSSSDIIRHDVISQPCPTEQPFPWSPRINNLGRSVEESFSTRARNAMQDCSGFIFATRIMAGPVNPGLFHSC